MSLPVDLSSATENILDLAQHYAAWHQSDQAEPEHMLLAMLDSSDEALNTALRITQIDSEAFSSQITAQLPPMLDNAAAELPPLSPLSQAIVSRAAQEVQHAGRAQMSGLDLLTGVLGEARQPVYAGPTAATNSALRFVREHSLQPQARGESSYLAPPALPRGSVRPSPVFLIPLLTMFGSGGALFMGQPDSSVTLIAMIFVFSGWIVSLCLHEFGHALVAYLGGDTSVREAGYLTLNPLKYSHPVLSIGMPVLFVLMGGIGLPGGAVYIQPDRLRSRTWRSATSLAGPAATLLCALLFASPFWFNWYSLLTVQNEPFWSVLAFLVLLQISALVFNLLPVPSLDGFGALAGWLPRSVRDPLLRAGNFIFLGLLLLMWRDGPVSETFWRTIFRLTDGLGVPLELVALALERLF